MDVAVLSREKKKIVIIGANEFQLPLVEAAARRGLETHVFAWEEGAVAREAADFFYPVSIVEKEKILSLAAPLRPAAAATIGSDLAGITVNYLTNRLSLPGNPPETAVLATDKPAMREAFRAAGLYTPRFLTFARGKTPGEPVCVPPQDAARVSGEPVCVRPQDAARVSGEPVCVRSQDAARVSGEALRTASGGDYRPGRRDGRSCHPEIFDGWQWPLIVKPVDRSGSRGVTRVDDFRQLPPALELAFSCSFSGEAIVEEFIEGEEFSCEGISFEGRHRLLQVTKKYTTEAPSYIERGHLESAALTEKYLEMVKPTVFRALDALHIRNGASHTEVRVRPDGEVCLIEAAARMGGDCIGSDLVPLTTGLDYVGMVLDAALGLPPSFSVSPREGAREAAGIRFVFNGEDLRRVEEAAKKRSSGVVRQCFQAGNLENRPKDSATRHGFCIFQGDETWLREILTLPASDHRIG